MKARKVLWAVACVIACASGSVFANTTNGWFGVTVGENINRVNCETNGVDVTIENSRIVLDNDLDSALAFIPDASVVVTNISDGLVTITSSAVLTPSDASDFQTVGGAQAGFAIGISNGGSDTNFYGYASKGGDGDAPAWIKLSAVPADLESPTTFTVALNYRDSKVSFYQGGNLLTKFETSISEFSISNDFTRLNNVSAYGSGSISSITSQFEVAVAAYDGKKYGSGAEAVIAAGQSGTVQDIDPTTGAATDQKQATNGLYAWQCDVLGIATDASIALQPATKEVASDKIAVAVSGYAPVDGVTVKFGVNNGTTTEGAYDADAIGIPMTTGTYTIVPAITATPAP